jgi:Alpha-L-fucosidase
MGLIGFAHFGINTFTGREWGDGTEDPALFDPPALDADQWARAFAAAGARQLILTCKHHDGFCLWPSRYTRHSVAASPWRSGRGDLVRELSEACRRAGLRFGVYLSPWDRNCGAYGQGQAYNEYYLGQLEELLTNYGEIGEVWFDGAKGPGVDQEYQVGRWVALIRRLQPNAAIFSESGPDIRWIGNESGVAGETNWSKMTSGGKISGTDAALLGSGRPDGSTWLVGECDVSTRPGWFHHPEEDSKVKTPEELADLYLKSVGRNAVLLLNAPPTKEGLVSQADIDALAALGRFVRESFSENLAAGARASSSSAWPGDSAPVEASAGDRARRPSAVLEPDRSRYWAPEEGDATPWLMLELPSLRLFDAVAIEEYVELGQRIASFRIEARRNGSWSTIARATTVGFRRILRIEPIEAEAIRLVIEESMATPLIRRLSIHRLYREAG